MLRDQGGRPVRVSTVRGFQLTGNSSLMLSRPSDRFIVGEGTLTIDATGYCFSSAREDRAGRGIMICR